MRPYWSKLVSLDRKFKNTFFFFFLFYEYMYVSVFVAQGPFLFESVYESKHITCMYRT